MSFERHAHAAAAARRALGPDAPSLRVPAKPAPRPGVGPRRWWRRLAGWWLQPAPSPRPGH
jgi:hypothetical protein